MKKEKLLQKRLENNMKIKIDSQIHISNPTKEIKNYVKQELEIKNPEIQKKKAMRFLDREYS